MINKCFTDSNFVRGNITVSAASNEDIVNQKHYGPISIKTSFINYLNFDVVVVMRNGLRHTVPFTPVQGGKAFIIRTEYTIRSEAFKDVENVMTVTDDISMTEMQAIREGYYNANNKGHTPRNIFYTDTKIDIDSFSSGSDIYITDKDISLSRKKLLEAVPHPFSNNTNVIKKYEDMCNLSDGYNFHIEIVDNENQLGKRFIYTAGKIYEVNNIKDISRQTGVYYGTSKLNNDGSIYIDKEYFTIKEAEEKLGLYKSMEEAMSGGDLTTAKAIELQKLKNKELEYNLVLDRSKNEYRAMTEEYKANTEKIKGDYTIKEMAAKAELAEKEAIIKDAERKYSALENAFKIEKMHSDARMTALKEKYDTQKTIRDDHYEQRSYERKDSSDFIKQLPALVVSVATLITLFIKLS